MVGEPSNPTTINEPYTDADPGCGRAGAVNLRARGVQERQLSSCAPSGSGIAGVMRSGRGRAGRARSPGLLPIREL